MPASRSKTWRDVALRAGALLLGQGGERRLVGDRAPEEGRNVVLLDPLQPGRDAGLAEIFLGEDVARHLAPGGGHLDVVQLEDDRAVRVPDLALGGPEFDSPIGAFALVSCSAARSAFLPHFRCASRACHPSARILTVQDSAPRRSFPSDASRRGLIPRMLCPSFTRNTKYSVTQVRLSPAFWQKNRLFSRQKQARNDPRSRTGHPLPETSRLTPT